MILLLLLLAAALIGCGPSEVVYVDDLAAIRARGEIRFLAPRVMEATALPRRTTPLQMERRLADAFAESEGLTATWVWVDDYSDLIPSLTAGRGDVIVANFTATPEREAQIAFSAGFAQAQERVVSHRDSAAVTSAADLRERQVTVRRSSSFWTTLRQADSTMEVIAAPDNADTEDLLYQVATGETDVTMADDLMAEMVQSYLPELRVDVALTEARDLAWGIRRENNALRQAVNGFIEAFNPEHDRPERYTGDLPAIQERKVLRVLTRNNAASYFIWRGQILGFEHDLALEFAKRLGVQVEFVVAPTAASLYAWLLDGRGDVVAAGVTPNIQSTGWGYSRPYNRAVETIVTRASDTTLRSLEDLTGRTVAVRLSSAYWDTAERLRQQGYDFQLVTVPEEMETEEVIEGVASGEYDLTIADSHILDIELTWRDDVRGAFAVGDSVPHVWLVRQADTELLDSVNAYFVDIDRSAFYNLAKTKYYGNPRQARSFATARTGRTGELSPYDPLVKRYAERFDFDWRMVAAQMYEESRFDPEAVSFAGAVGLMQLMPATARGFGFDSLTVPEVSIHAGTRYMSHVYYLLDEIPDPQERFWFSLASYNAGIGHVRDARRLAVEAGLDPNVWFGNVATVAPLLMRRSVHSKAEHGYCRCNEPVAYVRKIRDRERAYATVEQR